MIKKFLICLLTLFAISPTFAADDNVFFRAEAVESAINTMVKPDKRQNAAAEYQKQMDSNGRISADGMFKVCYAAGFNIAERGGYDDCQKFLGHIIDLSDGSTQCIDELDGVLEEVESRRENGAYQRVFRCVGRDGSELNYTNACTDKKNAADNLCFKTFDSVVVQYETAKMAVQKWATEKLKLTLTCKNMKTVSAKKKKKDSYLLCSAKGKPYTFKFSQFTPSASVDTERAGIAQLICKLTDNKNYTSAMVTMPGKAESGMLYFTCFDNGQNITDASKCAVIDKWARVVGAYSAQIEKTANPSHGGWSQSLPVNNLCVIRGGRTNTSKLVNELESKGVNNYAFASINARNSDDVINNVRDYARKQLGGYNTIECEYTGASITGSGAFKLVEKKKYDVVRCTIDGKKVDFVFHNLATKSNFKTKAGLQGMDCKLSGGSWTVKECVVTGKENCDKVRAQNAKTCPECKQVRWDENLEACLLPNSADAYNLSKGIQLGSIVVTAAAAGAVTIATGGTAGWGAFLLLVEFAGADIEYKATKAIDQAGQDFLKTAARCNDARCAETLVTEQLQRMANMQNDFMEEEVREIDGEFARLVKLVPESSDIFKKGIENFTLDGNRKGLLDFKNGWEPEQVWRAIGVGMQFAGLLTGVLNAKFFSNGPRLSGTTKAFGDKLQKALPAAKETNLLTGGDDAAKLLTKGDDAKLLAKADDVPLLPGQRMTRADAKALQDIEARNAKRLSGTATKHEKDLAKADFQKQQELAKRYGLQNNIDKLYMESRAVMQNEAIVAKEAELVKAKEELARLNAPGAQGNSKAAIRAAEGKVNRLTEELAGMGRTYANTASDAARTVSKADNAASAAAKVENTTQAVTKTDNTVAVARTASNSNDATKSWSEALEEIGVKRTTVNGRTVYTDAKTGKELSDVQVLNKIPTSMNDEFAKIGVRQVEQGNGTIRYLDTRAGGGGKFISESEILKRIDDMPASTGKVVDDVADAARAATKADDTARALTKVDDAARVASKADDAARVASGATDAARASARSINELDDAYKIGQKASTRTEVLEKWGLKADASDAEVAARYRDLAKKFHPDMARGDEELAKRMNDIMADISNERRMLDALPRETHLLTDGTKLAITAGEKTTQTTSKVVPMLGHDLMAGFAGGRAALRAINSGDGPETIVPNPVPGYGANNGVLGGAAGAAGAIAAGTGAGASGAGASGAGTVSTSGANGGVAGNTTTNPNERELSSYGGELQAARIIAEKPGSGNASSSNSGTNGWTGGQTGNGVAGGTNTAHNSSVANTSTHRESSTSTTNTSSQKSGISGLGAAAIGAGVVGLGVGTALLLAGDKDGKTATSATQLQSGNVDVFNAARARANGIIGYVNDSAIELVPIETVVGTSEKIVAIGGHAVVLVKHNGNKIPFMVDVENGAARWIPFVVVDMNTGTFQKYVPTADIMRTAQIAEQLDKALSPLQMQYFAKPNPDGVQILAPNSDGYKTLNNNDLRQLVK